MDGNGKMKWWKIAFISLLIIIPVAAVIVAFVLLNKDSNRDFTISID